MVATRNKTTWFLARTKPNRERYAADNVKRQGYRTLLPMYYDDRARRKLILFPSYLFVQTTGQWMFLESTYGCLGVVKRGENADPVPHHVIRSLWKEMAKDDTVELPKAPVQTYTKEQTLRVTNGSFAGCIGLYQGMDALHRVCVLLELLSRKVPMWLPAADVQAA